MHALKQEANSQLSTCTKAAAQSRPSTCFSQRRKTKKPGYQHHSAKVVCTRRRCCCRYSVSGLSCSCDKLSACWAATGDAARASTITRQRKEQLQTIVPSNAISTPQKPKQALQYCHDREISCTHFFNRSPTVTSDLQAPLDKGQHGHVCSHDSSTGMHQKLISNPLY